MAIFNNNLKKNYMLMQIIRIDQISKDIEEGNHDCNWISDYKIQISIYIHVLGKLGKLENRLYIGCIPLIYL